MIKNTKRYVSGTIFNIAEVMNELNAKKLCYVISRIKSDEDTYEIKVFSITEKELEKIVFDIFY